jgi:hypothetical protein
LTHGSSAGNIFNTFCCSALDFGSRELQNLKALVEGRVCQSWLWAWLFEQGMRFQAAESQGGGNDLEEGRAETNSQIPNCFPHGDD